jgi:hypothetical protein
MKTRVHVIALLVISLSLLMLGASSTFVSADPCTATLSYPIIPVVYSNQNVPIVVPLSASCTTYYSNQLYATGSAYDATVNTGLGSASTLLSSVSGGTNYNGQLGFNLPPSTQGHSIQISVSIYSSQYGNLLTATSEIVQVGSSVQQTTTTTVTQAQYPYVNPYPTSYPSPYQPNQSQYYQPQNQFNYPRQSRYVSQSPTRSPYNTNLLGYIVIIAIIAAVIIATAGLVLVARRQPNWPPPPPR